MAPVQDPCAHCGLPIPPADLVADRVGDRELRFCCRGCAGAYRIIVGAGLGAFYRRRQWDEAGTPAGAYESGFDDSYLARFVTPAPGGAELVVLVEGIRCASCVWLIERILARIDGVREARVSFATHRARVSFDPAVASPGRILAAVAQLGYAARPYTADAGAEAAQAERRSLLLRFGTAAFLSMQLMAYAGGLYAGYFQGIEPESRRLLEALAWPVATPVVFYSGWPFLRGGARSLRNRAPDMDLLISLGALSAYGYSVYALFAGYEVYFDTAAMIVTLILMGRLFEHEARHRASAGIDRLLRLMPEAAHRLEQQGSVDVDAWALRPGDRILVRPGERFPADGRVLAGETEVDEAAVTGEAAPVVRAPGSRVTSGTMNLTAAATVLVEAAGAASFVGRVARLVEEAQARKAPVQRMADRAAAVFVPLVAAVAAATAAAWTLAGPGPGDSPPLLHAVAVLVVACPCALGLATPTAVLVASGAAARQGILFRGGDVLEALARVRFAAFDKTGTLTVGRPRVVSLSPARGTEEALLRVAASAESGSSHPLARAVVEAAARRGLGAGSGAGAVVHPGRGVESQTPGGVILAGSSGFLESYEVRVPAGGGRGSLTEVHVSLGGEYLGSIGFEDELRPDAATTVARVRRMGLRTALLSGDREEAALRVGEALGIDEVRAGLSPEDKAEYLRAAGREGRGALMVGDGINDAPALSTAAVGCSMAGSTDIALESSDLVLTRPELSRIPLALGLARQTLRVIHQNLFWAFAYNLLAVPLAALGKVAPIYAAAAMAMSSACVLGNSVRLARTRRRPP